MTGTTHLNGQIPTDPHYALILLIGITCTASWLTTDQTQALVQMATALGSIAEFGLLIAQLFRHFTGGR